MTAGRRPTRPRQASKRKSEAETATGSRTQGRPARAAEQAAALMDGSHPSESVPTLIKMAWALGVKSSISDREWTIAGDAPDARRALAIRSMDTKLVMHWTSGARCRTASRSSHALRPHRASALGGPPPSPRRFTASVIAASSSMLASRVLLTLVNAERLALIRGRWPSLGRSK